MDLRPASPSPSEAALCASGVVELLEVLWGFGRDLSTGPISPSQLRVLLAVEGTQGINQRSLAEVLDSSPPSVSRLCDRLQAVGFLQRRVNPERRREVELHLTEHGRIFLERLREQRERELAAILATMSPAHRAALTTGLTAFQAAAGREGTSDSVARTA
ncbi:MarR family winged helix-turn-helix transcriptional regulator [Nonomuraea dietziae]|uniref:DNA-binding MarR family transcriptional regulator n=1 Tax=Nonomuraea dietziae TaxID=65515 RepID=A0A7W5VDU1_9ACTN|nr:MarR family transcriptional regulator [Nonomuraea dietziae]MBB3731825.1 DNA-binding MarR family transcriptional regulator [Nonomuraea dietziae]